jgi:NAD(P)H-dependent FMN reductase
MTTIAIVLGSTRPGRNGEAVARWVLEQASSRTDAQFELVDLRDHPLPHLDEEVPASMGMYSQPHTKEWAATIAGYDGFVFVTPEYNHGTTGVLKNALDYLYAEWNNKAAAFVSYGSAGGVRAVEHLRLVVGELQMADVRQQVQFSLFHDFESFSTFVPGPQHAANAAVMLDQVVAWADALAPLRAAAAGKAMAA